MGKDYKEATDDSERDAALQNLQEWTRYIEDRLLQFETIIEEEIRQILKETEETGPRISARGIVQRIPGVFEQEQAPPHATQETAEEKQWPSSDMDTAETPASSFTPPKPRIFTGEGDDRDAAILEAWTTALKD